MAVEPATSALLSGRKAGAHKIQGIGANFIPENFDAELCDDIATVSDEEAMREMVSVRPGDRHPGRDQCGRKHCGRQTVCPDIIPDQTVVTIAPDGADKYLSRGGIRMMQFFQQRQL